MTDQPQLRAWVVALAFADGLGIANTVAPNAESAAALAGVEAGRRYEGPPVSIAWMELTPEWLRTALRACETGKPMGDVVSLVSDNLRPAAPPPPPYMDAMLRNACGETCPLHGNMPTVGCNDCTRIFNPKPPAA